MAAIHLGDVGTVIELTVIDQDGAVVDISAASVLQIIFGKPDRSAVAKTAVLTNTGTDGKMHYVTVAEDLDQVGLWRAQGKVTNGSGSWKSDEVTFSVARNLA